MKKTPSWKQISKKNQDSVIKTLRRTAAVFAKSSLLSKEATSYSAAARALVLNRR